MKLRGYLLLVGLLALISWRCDKAPTADSDKFVEQHNAHGLSNKEADFVADAIKDKYANIRLAELATTKSNDEHVLDIAQQMVDSDSKILAKFQTFAEKNGLTVSLEERDDAKKQVNALVDEKTSDFDRKWRDEVMTNHKKNIRTFERMINNSDHSELVQLLKNSALQTRAQLDQLAKLENDSGS